jgi:glycosyltransferase involved in cell wall biosynthesis
MLSTFRDFGRPVAEAVRARPGLEASMVLAAWDDDRCEIGGLDCRFVRQREAWPGTRDTLRGVSPAVLDCVRSLQPDLIHLEGLLFPRATRALQRAFPAAPVVAQDHGTRLPRGWRRPVSRWGFRSLSGAIFTARAQADPFRERGVLPRTVPVFEVMEGSSPFVPGEREASRAVTGLAGDPCLLWLGNLDANKDPLVALEAVAIASRSLPDLRLYMCFRHAPLLEAVRERIKDPTLAGRVTLLGDVPYPGTEHYLRAADFLIQASHQEGSGFAVIEALACGATPLVTDIPSFRRITGEGRFGALVPVRNPSLLAQAIVHWSAQDRPALRRRARAHFEQSLSFAAVGRELRAVYDEFRSGR